MAASDAQNASQNARLMADMYPLPTRPEGAYDIVPIHAPGATPESAEKLRDLLEQNHTKFHIYFNDKGFHNHLSHHLFASWFFGASPEVLQAAFDEHASYQRAKINPPHEITDSNWTEHLDLKSEEYFHAYYHFFASKIAEHGPAATLEKYIFSGKSNEDTKASPNMVARWFSGLMHPMIHAGHVEFGIPGMLAEGMAQAAVTNVSTTGLFPREFFDDPQLQNDPDRTQRGSFLSKLTSLTLGSSTSSSSEQKHLSAFDIIARMQADPRLEPEKIRAIGSEIPYNEALQNVGDVIREYTRLWIIPVSNSLEENEKVVKEKVEELQWAAAVIYGLGGWREGHGFRSDFFLMHVLTSSLFLSAESSLLKHYPEAQSMLLRGHFAIAISWWITQGRPGLPIKAFYEHVTTTPTPPAKGTTTSEVDIKPDDSNTAPNPWFEVINHATRHPDEHLVKSVRALSHYAALYGTRKPGSTSFLRSQSTETSSDGSSGPKLDGLELLDGSLFIRVAGNAMDAAGWEVKSRENALEDTAKIYDFKGLGWDELWEEKH